MKRHPTPNPFPESHDNVVYIESFLGPLRCPRCDGQAISQGDQLEFAYPVASADGDWREVYNTRPAREVNAPLRPRR